MSELFYKNAVQRPLKRHTSPGSLTEKKNVILHITDGATAAGAIAWFENPASQVSAHFVIDRDGTITQLASIAAVTWHARNFNRRSIGIEHVGTAKLPCTHEQYQKSAVLIAWCCQQAGIPCDREHVRTHYECSPESGHVGCCTAALDPDKVVALAQDILLTIGLPA